MKPHETVILEIARERERQMDVEGWTPEHDDRHNNGELGLAAAAYLLADDYRTEWKLLPIMTDAGVRSVYASVPKIWPWQGQWWKTKDRRSRLVRSAALIVAEIERLDRLSKPETTE